MLKPIGQALEDSNARAVADLREVSPEALEEFLSTLKWDGRKPCEVCTNEFLARPGVKRCWRCRRLAESAPNTDFQGFEPGGELPKAQLHRLAPPLRQGVFDLETWGLDRGWGVLLVGSILIHGGGAEPEVHTFDLTQSPKWPDVRSDDFDLAARILQKLSTCHVLYAHNGARFDIPYLNSIALKCGMPRLSAKLIDPVLVARRKYRIGGNSLSSMAEFLGLPESKMPVGRDVWRHALLDNDPGSWKVLRERCESDVRLLNAVASHVTEDVGMIDNFGSAPRG